MLSGSLISDSGSAFARDSKMAWLVCLSAGLFFFYEFFQLNIFDVINGDLRRDFNLNAMQISLLSSMFLWSDIVFLLPAGIILDRFSPKKIILIAMFFCILGTFGIAMTNSFMLACFFRLLPGIGNAFCFLACVVLVSQWFSHKRQAFVIGLVVTMAFLGGMAAHTPFAVLVQALGWRHAVWVDGLFGIFLWIWLAIFVKDRRALTTASNHVKKSAILQRFLQVLRNPQVILAGLYTSFLNLPIMVLCALWGASYLQIVHGLSATSASNVISLIFFGSMIGCPLAGFLSDKQGRRKPVMIIGAVLTLITVLPLFIDISFSFNQLSFLFFLLGLVTSTQVIGYPLIAESTPPDTVGTATGIASVVIMGLAGVGQLAFGWLVQHHAGFEGNNYSMADFQFAMWMFPIAAVLSLLAVLFAREPHPRVERLEDV